MVRRYLQCDICGDKWDITDTELMERVNPGLTYIHNKVKDGVRYFKIVKLSYEDDGRVPCNDLDICDNCYNKIDGFIFNLARGEEDDDII